MSNTNQDHAMLQLTQHVCCVYLMNWVIASTNTSDISHILKMSAKTLKHNHTNVYATFRKNPFLISWGSMLTRPHAMGALKSFGPTISKKRLAWLFQTTVFKYKENMDLVKKKLGRPTISWIIFSKWVTADMQLTAIVPFHNDISPSDEQPEHRTLAHGL